MKAALIAVMAAGLAACASSSGVFQTGPGTYRISSTAITSFGGSATASGSAMKQATDHCAGLGRRMELVDQKSDAQFTGATVDVTFKCVPK